MHYSAPTIPALIPRFAVPLDENGLVDRLIDAEPGDRVAYYRGHLGHDRAPSAKVLDRDLRAKLHAVANRVMVLAGQGLVIPVQQRIGPGGLSVHRRQSTAAAAQQFARAGNSPGVTAGF